MLSQVISDVESGDLLIDNRVMDYGRGVGRCTDLLLDELVQAMLTLEGDMLNLLFVCGVRLLVSRIDRIGQCMNFQCGRMLDCI